MLDIHYFSLLFIYIINNSIYYDLNNPHPHIRVVELIVMGVWEGEVLRSNPVIGSFQFTLANIFFGTERVVIAHLDFLFPNSDGLALPAF